MAAPTPQNPMITWAMPAPGFAPAKAGNEAAATQACVITNCAYVWIRAGAHPTTHGQPSAPHLTVWLGNNPDPAYRLYHGHVWVTIDPNYPAHRRVPNGLSTAAQRQGDPGPAVGRNPELWDTHDNVVNFPNELH